MVEYIYKYDTLIFSDKLIMRYLFVRVAAKKQLVVRILGYLGYCDFLNFFSTVHV